MPQSDNIVFNVLSIMRGTTVDGPGFRTSIYLAGCNHRCPGCHNPSSWNKTGGTPTTLSKILDIVEEEDFNVTLSGGDPLCNPKSTKFLIDALKRNGRNVWVYTGYTWEEIIATPLLTDTIRNADVVVEGPFIMAQKIPTSYFAAPPTNGSSTFRNPLHPPK